MKKFLEHLFLTEKPRNRPSMKAGRGCSTAHRRRNTLNESVLATHPGIMFNGA
jgi:hypothetical protein